MSFEPTYFVNICIYLGKYTYIHNIYIFSDLTFQVDGILYLCIHLRSINFGATLDRT